MILGFGSSEKETAIKIINECANELLIGNKIDPIEKRYMDESEKYKKKDKDAVPERYSYFWAITHEIYPGKYIVEFVFHHINRRHPLSEDGWASLLTEWILVFKMSDHNDNHEIKIFKQE